MTIKETLDYTALPFLEKEIVLSHILKKDKSFLHAHPEKELTKIQATQLQKLISRRLKGEPIQYLTNLAHFYGLEFFVDKRVLIPREETEALVTKGLKFILGSKKKDLTVVDIGTGSGAIIISVAKNLPKNKTVKLIATDISKASLEVAWLNAKKQRVQNNITFLKGSLLEPLKTQVDLVLTNLPYVRTHLYGVLDPQITWEPKVAILGGDDGLKYYRPLFDQLPNYLKPDGLVLYEIDGRIYKLPQLKSRSFRQV